MPLLPHPCVEYPISSQLQQVVCMGAQYLDQMLQWLTKVFPQSKLSLSAYHKIPRSTK